MIGFILALAIGLVALVKGADIFVDGSVALARRFRVPSVIIGLTIVAMGTSAPELAVSVSAAINGANELAVSNVIGSNIFNLLAVLGICALICPVSVESAIIRRDLPLSLAAAAVVLLVSGGTARLFAGAAFGEHAGTVGRLAGAVLIAVFLGYTVVLLLSARRNAAHEEPGTLEASAPQARLFKALLLILSGLALIIGGGQAVIYGARNLAAALGLSETLIGLTVVAVGTSLPELVTSIVAARKGESALAAGNAVGSCIFNMLLILGLSALIRPIAVNLETVYDLLILILASVLTLIFAFTGKTLKRGEGAVMLALYVASVVFAAVR